MLVRKEEEYIIPLLLTDAASFAIVLCIEQELMYLYILQDIM